MGVGLVKCGCSDQMEGGFRLWGIVNITGPKFSKIGAMKSGLIDKGALSIRECIGVTTPSILLYKSDLLPLSGLSTVCRVMESGKSALYRQINTTTKCTFLKE